MNPPNPTCSSACAAVRRVWRLLHPAVLPVGLGSGWRPARCGRLGGHRDSNGGGLPRLLLAGAVAPGGRPLRPLVAAAVAAAAGPNPNTFLCTLLMPFNYMFQPPPGPPVPSTDVPLPLHWLCRLPPTPPCPCLPLSRPACRRPQIPCHDYNSNKSWEQQFWLASHYPNKIATLRQF